MVPPLSHPSQPPPQQFLTSVLSQRGPSSLPYAEDTKLLIRQHLLSLSETYPSLHPKTASFTHNDGRSVTLLQSHGTVPMLYQNVTYNIPVVIWLVEGYPRHAPFVFVNPTRDMIVKPNHPYVSPSGSVLIPYLVSWIYPSSNLVALVRDLSYYFGNHPPLFARPNPNPNPRFSAIGSGTVRPAIPPRLYAAFQSLSPTLRVEESEEVYKRNEVNKLVENVCSDVLRMRKDKEVEMEGMFSAQSVLRLRAQEVENGLREMRDEKEGLEHELQMVLMNIDVLEGWVGENEGKLGGESVNVDEAIVPADLLSRQMLECTASDLAIDDVVYALDKAVQNGCIPIDVYLRNVRLLSREQFIHRATCGKVRAIQMQDQVTSMASRASSYGV